MSYGTAETFFAAEELVLSQIAHRRVGLAEGVHLAEELREAHRIRLPNLLESVLVESCGRERLGRVVDGGEGIGRPRGLREPSDEFDPVVDSAWEALSDEDGGVGTQNAADLVCGARKIRNMVNHKGEPRSICRFIWQR